MNTDFFMDACCFACGKDNNNGLHLDIKKTDQGVTALFQVPVWCQGYEETVHGGIISTILDELAVWAAYHAGYKCVTGELLVRVKNPMHINVPYTANGSVVKNHHRLVLAYAEILDEQERLYAYAHAKLLRIT
jgi:uncharacterized protein (TIGR00369 family)